MCGENGREDTDMSIKETRCIANTYDTGGTVNCVIENSEKNVFEKNKKWSCSAERITGVRVVLPQLAAACGLPVGAAHIHCDVCRCLPSQPAHIEVLPVGRGPFRLFGEPWGSLLLYAHTFVSLLFFFPKPETREGRMQ